jgi:hypothetical protein
MADAVRQSGGDLPAHTPRDGAPVNSDRPPPINLLEGVGPVASFFDAALQLLAPRIDRRVGERGLLPYVLGRLRRRPRRTGPGRDRESPR